MAECNSVGGVVECVIDGLPAGIGDPVFEKYDASLAKAILSIGAVKGFEIGDGFRAAKSVGSENNDAFRIDESGKVQKETNHAGEFWEASVTEAGLCCGRLQDPRPPLHSRKEA